MFRHVGLLLLMLLLVGLSTTPASVRAGSLDSLIESETGTDSGSTDSADVESASTDSEAVGETTGLTEGAGAGETDTADSTDSTDTPDSSLLEHGSDVGLTSSARADAESSAAVAALAEMDCRRFISFASEYAGRGCRKVANIEDLTHEGIKFYTPRRHKNAWKSDYVDRYAYDSIYDPPVMSSREIENRRLLLRINSAKVSLAEANRAAAEHEELMKVPLTPYRHVFLESQEHVVMVPRGTHSGQLAKLRDAIARQ